MTSTAEIAERLEHFARNIEGWRIEASRLKLRVSEVREKQAEVEELVELEEIATDIYADITAFQATVDEVAQMSPTAAAQLAGVNDALHLVLLEITELGIGFYKSTSPLEDGDADPALAPTG